MGGFKKRPSGLVKANFLAALFSILLFSSYGTVIGGMLPVASAASAGSIILNTVQSTSGTTSVSNQIIISNFNAGTGSSQLLVVGVSANNAYVASITFGSLSLTKAVSSFANNDAEFWYLKGATGTGNIVVTFGGATSAVVGAYAFSGVDQTTPIPTTATNHNTVSGNPTISLATKYANDWVLDLPSIYGGQALGLPTCTQEWDIDLSSAITGASSSIALSSPGSATCSWTASHGGDLWDDVAVELQAAGTISPTVPSAPTGLAATGGNAQAALSWTVPSNNGGSAITGYNIYRSTTSGTEARTASVPASSTSYTDTGLTNGQQYFYKVTAVNAVGESVPSNEASATPATVSGSPTGLTATAGSSSQINLSWTAPSSNGGSTITGYKIERSPDNTNWSTIASNTGSTSASYSDTGLAASTTYYYRVSAINSVGTSQPSSTASATTQSASTGGSGPVTISNTQSTSGTVSAAPFQFTIPNYNVGTGANRLLVVGISANNAYANSITFGTASLTRAVTSFQNNEAEFYYLAKPNGTASIVVTMNGATSAVVGAYAFSGVNQTSPIAGTAINFNSPTTASSPTVSITTKYSNDLVADLPAIYGGVTLGSPTCTLGWDLGVPSAITGASSTTTVSSPGTVTCSWTASRGDQWDDVALEVRASGTTTTTVPSAPTGLAATGGNTQVSLSWSPPSSNGNSPITNYKVYRSTTTGTETLIATAGNVTSYTDTGLTNGQQYFYEVTAVNSAGESAKSNEANATPQATVTVPSAPTGLTANPASMSQINLSWAAPSSNGGSPIMGYEVERAEGDLTFSGFGNSTYNQFFSNGNTTSFADKGLSPSTTYNYTVFAKNSAGTGPHSNTPSATTSTTGPQISLDASSASIGTDIRITGTGFTPNSQVTVMQDKYAWAFNDTNDAPAPSTIQTDSNGNFVAVAEIEHTVAGQHAISAQDASGKAAKTFITIVPYVSIYPASGHAGTQVLIPDSQGSGFAASSTITATFDGQALTPSSPMATDTSGEFYQDTITIPSSASAGQHTLVFSDTKGNTYSVPFVVTSSAAPMYSLQLAASGLNLPDRMAFIPDKGPGVDGSGTFMVLEKNTGNVWVYKNTNSGFVRQPVAFVTVPNLQTGAEDNGLLGIAIDPNWANPSSPSKMVYFYATRIVNGAVMGEVIRYNATTDSSGNIVANSSVPEQDVINIPNWQDGHNGGCLRFDSSGNLYIEVSDGWQFSVHSQDLTSLQGKILRITPLSKPSNGQLYSIPSTNPFASSADPSIRKEIWSYGTRNSYSIDVDWKTNKVYASTVGYNAWEDIANFTKGGVNEGWAYYESPPYGNPDNLANYLPSIYWYPHEGLESNTAHPEGIEAIIGGVFYHGSYYPNLDGAYLFADYGVHFISALLPANISPPQMDPARQIPKSQALMLYEDTSIVPTDLEVWNGEVYVTDLRGQVYVLDYGTPNLSNQGCTAPSCPTALNATAVSSSQINLSWKSPTATGDLVTGYKIERATGSGNWVTLASNTGNTATTYGDTGLAASTIYTYRVSAINSTGTSQPSNTATTTTLCGPCTLQVSTQLSTGEIVMGYYTYLLNSTGTMVQSGFTPNTFYLNKGAQYSAGVDGYDTFVFDHWLDNSSTQNPRSISITSNTQITAVLRDSQPLVLSPPAGPAGTVVKASENHVFKAGNPVTVKYDGAAIGTTPSSITVNSTGGFTATFTVPPGSIGPHEVSATNGTNTHYAQFQDTAGTT